MVGRSIADQLRELTASRKAAATLSEPTAPQPRKAAQVDYSSPLEASRLAKQRATMVTEERKAPTLPPPPHPPRPADPEWVPRIRHRQDIRRRGLPYLGSTRTTEPARRTNHCYNCKSTVDSQLHAICSACTLLNIICPTCGACGCGFGFAARMVASDVEFTDDVESWLVEEGGRIAYPPAVAGEAHDWTQAVTRDRRLAYAEYLRSPTWREKRAGALKNAFFRCEECGDQNGGLHVHHKSYDRVGGGERPEDLQVLCENCHYHHHLFARVYVSYLAVSSREDR